MKYNCDGQVDMLRELGSIGAGNATTALAVMLNSRLEMQLPRVKTLPWNDLVDLIGGADNTVAGVMSEIVGDISGYLLFILDDSVAHQLANQITGTPQHNSNRFEEMDLSAVKEVGNILISSYLASLETLTTLKMRPSIPNIHIDMAGAILSYPAIMNCQEQDEVLLIESEFTNADECMNGYLLLMADFDSYNKIYQKLGIGC